MSRPMLMLRRWSAVSLTLILGVSAVAITCLTLSSRPSPDPVDFVVAHPLAETGEQPAALSAPAHQEVLGQAEENARAEALRAEENARAEALRAEENARAEALRAEENARIMARAVAEKQLVDLGGAFATALAERATDAANGGYSLSRQGWDVLTGPVPELENMLAAIAQVEQDRLAARRTAEARAIERMRAGALEVTAQIASAGKRLRALSGQVGATLEGPASTLREVVSVVAERHAEHLKVASTVDTNAKASSPGGDGGAAQDPAKDAPKFRPLPAPDKAESEDWQHTLTDLWNDKISEAKIKKSDLEKIFDLPAVVDGIKYNKENKKITWTFSKTKLLKPEGDNKALQKTITEALVHPMSGAGIILEAMEKSPGWGGKPLREEVLGRLEVVIEPPVLPVVPCCPAPVVSCSPPVACQPVECQPRRCQIFNRGGGCCLGKHYR